MEPIQRSKAGGSKLITAPGPGEPFAGVGARAEPVSSRGRRSNRGDQHQGINLQCLRELLDDIEAGAAERSFEQADVGPVDAGTVSQFFLRIAPLSTEVPQIMRQPLSECHDRVAAGRRIYYYGIYSANYEYRCAAGKTSSAHMPSF